MYQRAVFLLALLSQASIAASPVVLRAEAIHSAIEEEGAKKVVSELYENAEKWSLLLDNVSSGNLEWLRVARELRAGTDAGSSSMLDVAVTRALRNDSLETLRLMLSSESQSPPVFSPALICSSNFLIDYPADDAALLFIDNTIKKLRAIKDPELKEVRDQCILGLQEAKRDTLRVMREQQ